MIQRNLHLALAGVIAVGLALGILAFAYRDLTFHAAQETKFRENEAVANALSSANWPIVEALLAPPADLSRDELRNRPEVARLRDALDVQLRSRVLAKIKIYNLSGLTVFSSAEDEIGEDYSHIREIGTVRRGETVTRITRHPDEGGFESGGEGPGSALESYVPLRDPADGRIRGIYEVYANIAPFVQRMSAIESTIFYGILGLGAVYALLVYLFRRMEKESRFTQDFLNAVFENHPDMMLAKDAEDLRYVRANQAAQAFLGPSRQILGKLDRECFTKPQADFFAALDQEVLSNLRPLDFEGSIEIEDRRVRTLRLRKTPICFTPGKPRLVLSVAEDVTEQRQALCALKASEERYRKVLDHAGDAFFLFTLDGRLIDVNRHACESLGYEREELLRLCMSDIARGFDFHSIMEDWKLVTEEVHTMTGVHRRKDGTSFPVEMRLAAVSLSEEIHLISLARDISLRIRAELETQQAWELAETANREKSDYIARLGHGLRTPLHAVIGMTDLLMTTKLTRKQRNYVESIRTSGELVVTLVNDTLDFARLEAGTLQIEETTFSLADVVEGVVNIMGYRAYEKRLELACFFQTDVSMPLVGDPDHLREVLVNLVGNAVKFTHRGAVTIAVSKAAENGNVLVFRFSVQDTGIGISPQDASTLFKPFVQLPNRSNIDTMGSGLGLTISKKVAEAMGGRIEVESQPGEGSTFCFEVPLRRSAGAAERGLDPGLADRRVLAVARHAIVRRMLRHQLQVWHMHCDAVIDTGEALDLLRQEAAGPYDFAIFDLDGQEEEVVSLVHRVQSEPASGPMRVILLTPVARPVGIGLVSSLGDAQCLDKPVLPSRLQAALLGGTCQGAAEPDRRETKAKDLPLPQRLGERKQPRILVAEDIPVSRWLLLDMLESLGYQARAVADGASAIKAATETHYDVLLLDCQMPEMDGDQVAAELFALGRGKRPWIVAVTADVSKDNLNRCRASGMDEVLTKPLRLETLRERLEQWLPNRGCDEASSPMAAKASVGDESPVDPEAWRELLERDQRHPGFLSDLVQLFWSDADARLQAIASDLAEGRPDRVLRDVHALRAGCLQIGAKELAEVCKQMHQAAKEGENEQALSLGARLREESERVRRFLESEHRYVSQS
jgi:PAS domain S-box-containing protein